MAVLSIGSQSWGDPVTWGYITGALILLYIDLSVRAWYPLRHVPGPRLASFSNLWSARNHIQHWYKPAYISLKKYGSIVRVAPNYVLTDDPEVLRQITTARSKYTRDVWNTVFKVSKNENLFNTMDVAKHDPIKSQVVAGYHGRENPDLEDAIDSQVMRLVDLLRRKYLSTADAYRPVDFAPLSRYFTLDVITRLVYGKAFGHLDEGRDVYSWVEQIDLGMAIIRVVLDVPPGFRNVMGVASDHIDQRMKEDAKSDQDMLGSFLRNGMTRTECEEEAMLAIVTGSDTTAGTIRFMLYRLIRTPRVYSRFKDEIRKSLARRNISSPITLDQAKDIPYLQAMVWESVRLGIPFTHGHYKVVPPGGDTLNGIFLPAGTATRHNAAAVTRNEAIFRPDVEILRPERFLECDESKRMEIERALDILFGGGRWMCAGKTVAFMKLYKVFFELMRVLNLEFANPERPWVKRVI